MCKVRHSPKQLHRLESLCKTTRAEPEFTKVKKPVKPQKGRCLIQCKQLPKQILTMCQSEMVATCEPLCKAGESVTRLWTYHHLVHTYKIGYKRFRVFFFPKLFRCRRRFRIRYPLDSRSCPEADRLRGGGPKIWKVLVTKPSRSNFLSISFWLFPSSFSTLLSFTFLS